MAKKIPISNLFCGYSKNQLTEMGLLRISTICSEMVLLSTHNMFSVF